MDNIAKRVGRKTVFELIRLDDGQLSVDVDLSYDTRHPHTVRLTLAMAGGVRVTWLVSRAMLAEGLTTPVGVGDVRFLPLSPQTSLLLLRSGGDQAWFRMPVVEIAEFLGATHDLVPADRECEWFDFDAALATVLAEDAGR
jgi:Streptomyces sporulation and cell division protein, SsgA